MCIFITPAQQKLMLFMYPDNLLCFDDQNIFGNKQWFDKEMKKLLNFECVEKLETKINGDMRERNVKYRLIFRGKVYVEKNILDYNNANGVKI